jgi:hypothetical protein
VLPDSHQSTLAPLRAAQTMDNASARNDRYISLLSNIVIRGYNGDFSAPDANLGHLQTELKEVAAFTPPEFANFVELADTHHVVVRALAVIEKMASAQNLNQLAEMCNETLSAEHTRIAKAVESLYAIVQALDMSGCPPSVIKSLDHWPDLGSDLDLYTSGSAEQVVKVMKEKMKAELEARSWGDRLAGKWNFQIPGLKEHVEIHVR